MPLLIISSDITKVKCDAIVNAANSSLLGGGGVDGAIHKAAGAELLKECKSLGGCKTGDAKVTMGYNLPCKYVIHTVGPIWCGGNNGERELLESCYKKSLALAKQMGCESVAFPLISSGIYGYPKDKALQVATSVIEEFLLLNELTVYMVIYDKCDFIIDADLYHSVSGYLQNNLYELLSRKSDFCSPSSSNFFSFKSSRAQKSTAEYDDEFAFLEEDLNESGEIEEFNSEDDLSTSIKELSKKSEYSKKEVFNNAPLTLGSGTYKQRSSKQVTLEDMLAKMDDNFAVTLLKLIDLKGISDVECYKKANVSKQTWYKIMNERDYRPSKNTVLCFAIALKLTLEETEKLLATVGFTLSKSSKFDIIIEYFILNEEYNVFIINETLFKFDQVCLGG